MSDTRDWLTLIFGAGGLIAGVTSMWQARTQGRTAAATVETQLRDELRKDRAEYRTLVQLLQVQVDDERVKRRACEARIDELERKIDDLTNGEQT